MGNTMWIRLGPLAINGHGRIRDLPPTQVRWPRRDDYAFAWAPSKRSSPPTQVRDMGLLGSGNRIYDQKAGPSIEFPVISHKRSRSLVHFWEGERVWVPFMSEQRKEAKLSYSFP